MADAALVVALLRGAFGKNDPEGGSAIMRLLYAMAAALGPAGQSGLNS